jgi:hypothetical protein
MPVDKDCGGMAKVIDRCMVPAAAPGAGAVCANADGDVSSRTAIDDDPSKVISLVALTLEIVRPAIVALRHQINAGMMSASPSVKTKQTWDYPIERELFL